MGGANIAWAEGLAQAGVTCTVTLLVALALFHPGPQPLKRRERYSTWIKVGFMLQFVLLGWLGYLYVYHTQCGYATQIWFVYAPGFLCYATKPLLNDRFLIWGPHECFHVLVYAGHLVS